MAEYTEQDRREPHASDDASDLTMDARFLVGEARMQRMEDSLKSNTEATNEVLEILVLGKSFFKVIGYFGSFVKWGAAILAPVIAAWVAYKAGAADGR